MVENIPVVYEGKAILYLNGSLAHFQRADIEKSKKLHIFKHLLFEKMNTVAEEDLPLYNKYVVELEFALQRAWNFPEDPDYHKHWLTPRCTCPKMDNEDWYPSKIKIYYEDCPVHKEGK